MKRETKTRILSFILLTVMLVAAVLALEGCTRPTPPGNATIIEEKTLGAGQKTISFMMVNSANEAILHTIHTDAGTLRQALDEHGLIGMEGTMVYTVCGVRADYALDGVWWKLYIGQAEAVTGVDGVIIENGGEYSFVCTPAF